MTETAFWHLQRAASSNRACHGVILVHSAGIRDPCISNQHVYNQETHLFPSVIDDLIMTFTAESPGLLSWYTSLGHGSDQDETEVG